MKKQDNCKKSSINIDLTVDYIALTIESILKSAKERAEQASFDFSVKRRKRKTYTTDQLGKLYIEEPIRYYLSEIISSIEPLNININELHIEKDENYLLFLNYKHQRNALNMMIEDIKLIEKTLLSTLKVLQRMLIVKEPKDNSESEAIKYNIKLLLELYKAQFYRYYSFNIYLEILSKAINIKGLEYACLYGWECMYRELIDISKAIKKMWEKPFIELVLPTKDEILEKAIYRELSRDIKEYPSLPPLVAVDRIENKVNKGIVRVYKTYTMANMEANNGRN